MTTNTSSPTHPTGILTRYSDVTGRKQTSVRGPKGTVLITNTRDGETYRVWYSDTNTTLATVTDKTTAIEVAFRHAGIEL